MRYFLDDGSYSHELSVSEIDLQRGVLNYENRVDYDPETKQYSAEEVGLYDPNPEGMTFAEMDAVSPMADADVLKILFNVDVATIDEAVDDATALHMQRFYPEWQTDEFYRVGDRRMYDGRLYRALTTHTAQEGWTPSASPSLWAKILPGQQEAEIGEWEQPDSTNPYMKGDRVTHNGSTWESDVDGNVWEPGVYGWALV